MLIRKLLLFTLCSLSVRAFATDYLVTSTDDSGPGTLREAINSLEVGGDTITFDDSLSGTIVLASPLPILSMDTVITGPTTGSVTIDGDSTYQIFEVSSYSTISNLTLTNNDSTTTGSAVLINGFALASLDKVTITHCGSSCEAPIKILENGGLFSNNMTFSSPSGTGVDIFFEDGSVAILSCDLSVQPEVWVDGTGEGVIYKEGEGTMVIKAVSPINIFMGADEGKLIFSGTNTDAVYVFANGTFEGTPTVYYVSNGGITQTGNDFGTITNSHGYYQSSNGTLNIKIDALGNTDLIHAFEEGLPAGNLVIQLDPGTYTASSTYTLITCDEGFNTAFDNAYFDLGMGLESISNASLSYISDSVVLAINSTFTVNAPSLSLAKSHSTRHVQKTIVTSPVSQLFTRIMQRKTRPNVDVPCFLRNYPKQLKKDLLKRINKKCK
jgi:hypothetical protein